MKKINTLVAVAGVLLSMTLAGEKAGAQEILSDSLWGGQLQILGELEIAVTDTDTVVVNMQWSFNINFIPVFTEVVDTIETTGLDTLTIASADLMNQAGFYFARYQIISSDTTIYGNPWPVAVDEIWVLPTAFVNGFTPTMSGYTVSLAVDDGNTEATLHVYEIPGGTLYNEADAFLMESIVFENEVFINHEVNYYPPNYPVALHFVIENPVGIVHADTILFVTLAEPGLPWTSQPILESVGQDSVVVSAQVVTNGLETVASARIRVEGTSVWLDEESVTLPASNGQTETSFTFNSLTPATTYEVETSVLNSEGEYTALTLLTITTESIPIPFGITTLSANAVTSTSTEIFGEVTVPTGYANWGLLIAGNSDVNFNFPIYASVMTQTSGTGIFSVSAIAPDLQTGSTYHALLFGFDSEGNMIFDPSLAITFTQEEVTTISINEMVATASDGGVIRAYSSLGQFMTEGESIDFSLLRSGVYILECGGKIKKVVHTQ